MNRAERRFRTEKIAKKRFRQLYCAYHGTPEAWFYRAYNLEEQSKKYGQCRDRRYSWRCRCNYCQGGIFLNQSIAEQNFRDQLEEAVQLSMPFPNVLDASSVGPYDGEHELSWRVCPWSRCWRTPDTFHHPKQKIRSDGR